MNIEKLPKWAQEYIERLQRQRDEAVDELKNYLDDQTPCPFYHTDSLLDGAYKIRYLNGVRRLEVEYAGVYLQIALIDDDGRFDGIQLSWGDGKFTGGEVAFIPESFQMAKLVNPKHMRLR